MMLQNSKKEYSMKKKELIILLWLMIGFMVAVALSLLLNTILYI